MKFGDVPIGSYILIPCPRCGEKKRRKVTTRAVSQLAIMRAAICMACQKDDLADSPARAGRRPVVRLLEGFRIMDN